MFSELEREHDQKHVGLPWLPSIPKRWKMVRAKELLRPLDVRSTSGTEELLTVSSARGVVPRSSQTVTMFQAASYVGHKLCWPGDLVINSLWAWGRGLGVSQNHGIVSTAYGVYRPRTEKAVHPEFLHALVRSEPFNWELTYRSRGVWISRLQLTDDRFLAAPMPLPPADEQAAIVKYLGHAHARIDKAIAAKRKMIALLEEQKQAVIHRAVTRGLNPNVPLKDSGIPWLGQMPSHWDRARVKDVLTRNDGGTWGTLFSRDGTIVLRSTEQNADGTWRIEDPAVIVLSDDEAAATRLVVDDLVITKSSGSQRHIGKTSLVDQRVADLQCSFSNFMQRLRCNERAIPTYLALFLNSSAGREHYRVTSRSTTGLGNLTAGIIGAMPIPLPPPEEQAASLATLAEVTSGADGGKAALGREISLLQEFRTRLTSDVVTGQVDVRAVAAALPDLPEETLAAATGGEGSLDDVAEEFLEGEPV